MVRTSTRAHRFGVLGVDRCPLPARGVGRLTTSDDRLLMMRSKRPFMRRRVGTLFSTSIRIGKHLANSLPHANRLAPSGITATLKHGPGHCFTTPRGVMSHPPTLYRKYKRHSMCATLGRMLTSCPRTHMFTSVNYCALNTLPPFHTVSDYISVNTSVAVTGKTSSTKIFPTMTIVNSSAFARSNVAKLLSTIGSGTGVAMIVSSGLAATVAKNRSSTKADGFRTVYYTLNMRPRRMHMMIPLPGGVRRVGHIVRRRVGCRNISIVVPHQRYVRAFGHGTGRGGTGRRS